MGGVGRERRARPEGSLNGLTPARRSAMIEQLSGCHNTMLSISDAARRCRPLKRYGMMVTVQGGVGCLK